MNCLKCPFSNCDYSPTTSTQLRHHISVGHKADDTESKKITDYRFICRGCARKFVRRKYFEHTREVEASLNNHARKRQCPADEIAVDSNQVETETDEMIAQPLPQRTDREAVINNNYEHQITNAIDNGYLGALGNQAVSVTSIVQSINIATDLTEATVIHAEHLVRRLLTLNMSDQPELLSKILDEMPGMLNKIRAPLKIVNSRYYFEKYFTDLVSYVKPVYKSFMKDKTTERFVGDDVYDPKSVTLTPPCWFDHCGYYCVPLGESLSRLFSTNPELMGCLQTPSRIAPQVYKRAVDGASCRNNILLMDPTIKTVALCLTFDDVQVTSKGMRKETVYQVSVMNLPSFYSTSPEGMLLTAQGNSKDFNAAYRQPGEHVKTTGTNMYLKDLTKQIRGMETNGCNVVINGRNHTLYATLVAVVADNLAVHQVFSFAASFSKLNYPCVICKIHKSAIGQQSQGFNYREECETELWAEKAKQGYEQSKGAGAQMTALCGIKGTCELRPHHWSITRNRTIDVMHDIGSRICLVIQFDYYGVVQFGIIALFRFAENDQTNSFTILKFNSRLKAASFGKTDNKNSFTHINPAITTKNPDTLKWSEVDGALLEYDASAATGLRAAQGYTLLKLLDYLIPPSMIPRTSLVWLNLMRLRAVALASHSFVWAESELKQWRYCYDRTIQEIYTFTLTDYPRHRPKNHFGIHADDATRANGPPIVISCYAPERMLGKITAQCDASGNNAMNLTKTSVKMRQFKQAINLMRQKPLKDRYRTDACLKPCDQCPYREGIELIKHKVPHSFDDWFWANKFSLRGYTYIRHTYVCLVEPPRDTEMPTIYKIEGVFLRSECEKDAWVLVRKIRVLHSIGSMVYGGYVIDENPTNFELMCLRNLIDHHPMDGYCNWATLSSDMIIPGQQRIYMHSNSRWLVRHSQANHF